MKGENNHRSRVANRRPARLQPWSWLGMSLAGIFLIFLSGPASRAAERFGDVSVSPNAIYTGNTFHGYAEIRVVVENHSPTRAHQVTLSLPTREYRSYGNTIRSISRTAIVAPDTREVMVLLQPPLPIAAGDESIQVKVDGRQEGEVAPPNPNRHCTYGRGSQPNNVLVSRSLDFDAVTQVFQMSNGVPFTAAKAIGPPDAAGMNREITTWMPENGGSSGTNWLELDYATPQIADKVAVYNQASGCSSTLTLITVGSTNVLEFSKPSVMRNPAGSGWIEEFDFSPTTTPIKTVRVNFIRTAPRGIAIDAVELSGPSGAQWASGARASSDNSAAATAYSGLRGTPDDIQTLRSESPVSEWSENWLAYSPFEAVVFTAADLARMPPGVFAALGDYVHAGGNIVLLGTAELPASWHAAQETRLAGGREFYTGFGRVFAFASENLALMEAQPVKRLRAATRESGRYFKSLPEDTAAANNILPVVENLKIPVRGTVLVMLAFVILIGPVNIFYLNRIKRRTWMVWTVPAISLATTLLVFVYSLVREGITPDVRIAGLTILDQASHRAATIGVEAFYCPLTPRNGLSFDYTMEATPLVTRNGPGSPREVDWSQSQHFSHGWLVARVPAHFHIRQPEMRRERLQIVNTGGRLEIYNSLGAEIKTIWFADAQRHGYEGHSIAAGEKGGLISTPGLPPSNPTGASGLLRDIGFAAPADKLEANAGKYLLPNTYIAVLDRNPFLENALGPAASPARTRSSAVVFGVMDSDAPAENAK